MPDDAFDQLMARLKKCRSKPGSPGWLIAIFFLVVLTWIIWAATSSFWSHWAGATDPQGKMIPVGTATAGAWGDSFGGFNALVGALGFGAVAITLHLQYRSLERQKIEQHISKFEENFFRLMELMRSLRVSLKYEQTSNFLSIRPKYARAGSLTGYDAIEAAYYEVSFWAFKNHADLKGFRRKVVANQYDNYVHNRFESCFAPYFRIIYTILYIIRYDEVLSVKQKEFYGNILRSQLTSFEIGLMAFNATSKYAKDLDDLITYFRLLKYLPRKRRRILGNIFPKEAYLARS